MGHFSDFLDEKGVSTDRLLQVSRRLESVRSEDRDLMLQRAQLRRGKAGTSYAEANLAKPRSGRPLRPGHVRAAMDDKPVTAPVRSKMVRAMNLLLEKKGQGKVSAPQLFGKVPGTPGKQVKKT